MKKFFTIIIVIAIFLSFIGTAVFLYKKSQEKPVVFETDKAFVTDIIKKTIATGKIIPRRDVEIKSQVSGVVEERYVEGGEKINKGDLIAKIRIIPNIERLNAAESRLETAKLNFSNTELDLNRQKKLYDENLIAEFEYRKYVHSFNLGKESLTSAENNLQIIREGASKKTGSVSNLVTATLSGLVLDVPVKEGTFVTETNNFNPGTTIASIANMQDMIFEGTVDESEVGKIQEGMELLLNVGAMESEPFVATLEYISPKGWDDQGTIKFSIRAAVTLRDDKFLRAGYSANADIVLDRRDQVLAINERLLIFEEEQIFVEVETSPQVFDKREVQVGLSDGINIEILSGITIKDSLKRP